MRFRWATLVAAVAVTLALAGCGADGDDQAAENANSTGTSESAEQTEDSDGNADSGDDGGNSRGELSDEEVINKTVKRLALNYQSVMPADGERSVIGTIDVSVERKASADAESVTSTMKVISHADAVHKLVYSETEAYGQKLESYVDASTEPYVQYSNVTGEWQKQTLSAEEFSSQQAASGSAEASDFFGETSDYTVVHEDGTYRITGPVNIEALFAGADISDVTLNSSSLDFVVDDETFDPIRYDMAYDMTDSDGALQVMDMSATMEYQDVTVTIPDEVLAAPEA